MIRPTATHAVWADGEMGKEGSSMQPFPARPWCSGAEKDFSTVRSCMARTDDWLICSDFRRRNVLASSNFIIASTIFILRWIVSAWFTIRAKYSWSSPSSSFWVRTLSFDILVDVLGLLVLLVLELERGGFWSEARSGFLSFLVRLEESFDWRELFIEDCGDVFKQLSLAPFCFTIISKRLLSSWALSEMNTDWHCRMYDSLRAFLNRGFLLNIFLLKKSALIVVFSFLARNDCFLFVEIWKRARIKILWRAAPGGACTNQSIEILLAGPEVGLPHLCCLLFAVKKPCVRLRNGLFRPTACALYVENGTAALPWGFF